MTREELLSKISSQELTDWMAYFIVEAEEIERERAKQKRG